MQLLSPAGSFEKMKSALLFGADAIYFSGEQFSLRAKANNFSDEELAQALQYIHERGKKGYITLNIYAYESELEEIRKYIRLCDKLGADGLIISDPGIFQIAKEENVRTPLFISTQASTLNSAAVNFWQAQGAARVILGREVKKNDLERIIKNSKIDIEVFIHGAICISVSGRCLISSYMTGKSANHGECTQPCRWSYSLMEENREGEHFPVYEDERGTYLYNSKDLCLIDRIGELVKMGVASGKVEGRMKSVLYVSTITGIYRKAIDLAKENPDAYKTPEQLKRLLNIVSNRGYIEGFYSNMEDNDTLNRQTSGYSRAASFLGVVSKNNNNEIELNCRSKFMPNDEITIITPALDEIVIKPEKIYDEGGFEVQDTRPNYIYKFAYDESNKIPEGSLIIK